MFGLISDLDFIMLRAVCRYWALLYLYRVDDNRLRKTSNSGFSGLADGSCGGPVCSIRG